MMMSMSCWGTHFVYFFFLPFYMSYLTFSNVAHTVVNTKFVYIKKCDQIQHESYCYGVMLPYSQRHCYTAVDYDFFYFNLTVLLCPTKCLQTPQWWR